MLRREILLPLLGVLAVAAAGYGGWYWWDQAKRAEAEQKKAEREQQEQERQDEAREWLGKLQDESAELMPHQLDGLALGMTLDELRSRRPEAQPSDKEDPDKIWLEEVLANRAQVLYGVDAHSERLLKVQVMSRLPKMEAIKPHLAAMNEQYGTPTGMWNCPDTGGAPTLRFTWRKNVTAIADVFLIHPGGVSVTLYIAPAETIGRSLRQGACKPTTTEELAKNPPVATPEQLGLKNKGRTLDLRKQGAMR